MVLGLEECENSHTFTTTTTTRSKSSQKEVNNQIDNQNQCSVPPKVPSLQALALVLSQVQDTHSATISVYGNQLKCCFDQQAQLKQLRLVNLTENDAQHTFKLLVRLLYECGLAMDLLFVKTIIVSID